MKLAWAALMAIPGHNHEGIYAYELMVSRLNDACAHNGMLSLQSPLVGVTHKTIRDMQQPAHQQSADATRVKHLQ